MRKMALQRGQCIDLVVLLKINNYDNNNNNNGKLRSRLNMIRKYETRKKREIKKQQDRNHL